MKSAENLEIRAAGHGEAGSLMCLYPLAFPDEDLRPLVRNLLEDSAVMSLVATVCDDVAGHIALMRCSVERKEHLKAALLGPLAVDPGHQRRGVGSALVTAGLDRLREEGVDIICVLGDPAYYARFGFRPERKIVSPYPLPDEWVGAWQSHRTTGMAGAAAGKLAVPRPWREPALWAP